MVKTRRGAKRAAEPLESEPVEIEQKKHKTEVETKSKYFSEESVSTKDHMKESGLDMNEEGLTLSNDSKDSVILNKRKRVLTVKNESDSDDSSSDEFMKAPFSLDDLGNFETIKTEPVNCKANNTFTSAKLSDDSDIEKVTKEQDYYDFSQIIQSQEFLIKTKNEQEERAKKEKEEERAREEKVNHVSYERKGKNISKKSSKKTSSEPKHDIKSVAEELGVSELLAMAEGPSMFMEGDPDSLEDDSDELEAEPSYSVPEQGVQVTIELPNAKQKKKSKAVDMEAAVKRRINLIRKENQVFMHKVHTLCWIAHGIYLNRAINSEDLMALSMSLIPAKHCYPPKHADLRCLEQLVEWFVAKIEVNTEHRLALNSSKLPLLDVLEQQINLKIAFSQRDLVLIFVCMVRSLGITARLIISLRPVPLRPPASDLCSVSNKAKEKKVKSDDGKTKKSVTPSKAMKKTNQQNKNNVKDHKEKQSSLKGKDSGCEMKSPYFSSSDDVPLKNLVSKNFVATKSSKRTVDEPLNNGNSRKSPRNQRSSCKNFSYISSDDEVEIPKQNKNCLEKSKSSNSKSSKQRDNQKIKLKNGSDSDFETPKASGSRKKSIDRRVLSSDEESYTLKKIGNDFWTEVFLEAEEKWISVDLKKGRLHCIQQLSSRATQPMRYVLAWNNDGSIKDLTRRYAPLWLTVTRRLRADDTWWKHTLAPYAPRPSHREREEDEDLDRQMHDKPLPTSISEYKNHPLYALKRHLLKFEAIYPPDAPTLGFVRGEAVYSRGCVADLHTRETWIKDAKIVRRGEEPYKIVKARPKWDKLSQTVINDLPLPLFGHWQVDDYIPPPAVDGKVPRNEYGNVELYKPCMLPPGTVHLQVPQLARVARKLNIDCAPAVVGWEFSGGGSHPVLDGFIVCEEFKDVLLDAWNKEMDESAKRAKEKVEQRVYGNWKRLIKGLLIRERLKARYDFGVPVHEKKKKKQRPKASTSKS